jgi:hypothetical protein
MMGELSAQIAAAELLARSGVPPTHVCTMCGYRGHEDWVVGCLRCGWDEMVEIEREPPEAQA